MKHVWKQATVYNKRSGAEAMAWLRAKQAELERKTAVRWSWEPAHGEFVFWPIMREQDAEWFDYDVADLITSYLKPFRGADCYQSLLSIATAIGIPLPEVCGTCWVLVKQGTLKPTVDRMGKPHAVALVQ